MNIFRATADLVPLLANEYGIKLGRKISPTIMAAPDRSSQELLQALRRLVIKCSSGNFIQTFGARDPSASCNDQ